MKIRLAPLILLVLLTSCMNEMYRKGDISDVESIKDSVIFYKEIGKSQRNASRYKEALASHERGLELACHIEDTLEIVQALNNIGTVYRRMGLLDDAASWHYKALNYCDRWSDKTSPTSLKNRVISLNGIGNVHLSMGNDALAMEAFKEALEGESRLGSATGQAINHANIGAIYEDRGQLDSARYHYTESMRMNEAGGNVLGVALCKIHFGRLDELQNDAAAALKNYSAAYDLLKDGDDKWHWLQAASALVRINLNLGNRSAARYYADESIPVAYEIGSTSHLVSLYNNMYGLERQSGNYRRALEWLEKYTELSGALSEERNDKEIYDLKATYERERSQLELTHLRKTHQHDMRRRNMMLWGGMGILLLALLTIVILVYALLLRSRNHKMLKNLDKTKNNYFTNIAHEFRTPLTVIMSAARHIYKTASDDLFLKEDARDILVQSDDMLNLVNQVLDIARMTSGLAPDPVWRRGNVFAYVSGVCERYSRLASEKGVQMDVDIPDDDSLADFVPDLLHKVLRNLLSNSIKYTHKGGRVDVSVRRQVLSSGEFLSIRVADNGIGMTEDEMSEIFRPFYQASEGSDGIGIGVGLSVVKQSVESMGGEIKVSSSKGEGAEFVVILPVDHGASEEYVSIETSDDFSRSEISVNEDIGELDTPKVLIVEDKPEVARWEMRQLNPQYSFYFASDGVEGLSKAEELVPDVIITDVMMPNMDGLEFCRRIRKSDLLSHIPVIMVTAKTMQEDRIRGLQAGADAYIEKPYDEAELSLNVDNLISQRNLLKKKFTEGMYRDDYRSCVESAFMDKFDALLDEALEEGNVDCEILASKLCIGRAQLNRKIKAVTGYRTTEYVLLARIAKAKKLLRTTMLPISDVALKCGVEDVGYFSTLFKKTVGVTPTAFRRL